MGMFDEYVFQKPEQCSNCGAAIKLAQGKGADCILATVIEGRKHQRAAYDMKLPQSFVVYAICNKCKTWNQWDCESEENVWVRHYRPYKPHYDAFISSCCKLVGNLGYLVVLD